MKLHPTVVNKLLTICQNQGGYSLESRLLKAFTEMRLSVYAREGISPVFVETDTFMLERTQRDKPVDDIVPMRFHSGSVKKLLDLYSSYSGHAHEQKLRVAFASLDFTPYEMTTTGEAIVILTDEYMRALQNAQ